MCLYKSIGIKLGKYSDFFLFASQVAAEVAAPLSQAKKITMVSSGNGTVGAEKLTEEVFNIVQRVPDLVKNLTGVDIAKVRTKLVTVSTVKEM